MDGYQLDGWVSVTADNVTTLHNVSKQLRDMQGMRLDVDVDLCIRPGQTWRLGAVPAEEATALMGPAEMLETYSKGFSPDFNHKLARKMNLRSSGTSYSAYNTQDMQVSTLGSLNYEHPSELGRRILASAGGQPGRKDWSAINCDDAECEDAAGLERIPTSSTTSSAETDSIEISFEHVGDLAHRSRKREKDSEGSQSEGDGESADDADNLGTYDADLGSRHNNFNTTERNRDPWSGEGDGGDGYLDSQVAGQRSDLAAATDDESLEEQQQQQQQGHYTSVEVHAYSDSPRRRHHRSHSRDRNPASADALQLSNNADPWELRPGTYDVWGEAEVRPEQGVASGRPTSAASYLLSGSLTVDGSSAAGGQSPNAARIASGKSRPGRASRPSSAKSRKAAEDYLMDAPLLQEEDPAVLARPPACRISKTPEVVCWVPDLIGPAVQDAPLLLEEDSVWLPGCLHDHNTLKVVCWVPDLTRLAMQDAPLLPEEDGVRLPGCNITLVPVRSSMEAMRSISPATAAAAPRHADLRGILDNLRPDLASPASPAGSFRIPAARRAASPAAASTGKCSCGGSGSGGSHVHAGAAAGAAQPARQGRAAAAPRAAPRGAPRSASAPRRPAARTVPQWEGAHYPSPAANDQERAAYYLGAASAAVEAALAKHQSSRARDPYRTLFLDSGARGPEGERIVQLPREKPAAPIRARPQSAGPGKGRSWVSSLESDLLRTRITSLDRRLESMRRKLQDLSPGAEYSSLLEEPSSGPWRISAGQDNFGAGSPPVYAGSPPAYAGSPPVYAGTASAGRSGRSTLPRERPSSAQPARTREASPAAYELGGGLGQYNRGGDAGRYSSPVPAPRSTRSPRQYRGEEGAEEDGWTTPGVFRDLPRQHSPGPPVRPGATRVVWEGSPDILPKQKAGLAAYSGDDDLATPSAHLLHNVRLSNQQPLPAKRKTRKLRAVSPYGRGGQPLAGTRLAPDRSTTASARKARSKVKPGDPKDYVQRRKAAEGTKHQQIVATGSFSPPVARRQGLVLDAHIHVSPRRPRTL